MKKRNIMIAVFLSLCMVFAFTGCGGSDSSEGSDSGSSEEAVSAEQSEDAGGTGCTYDFPGTGFGFELPEGVELTKGYIRTKDMGEVEYNSGVMMGWPVYADMTEEEVNSLKDEDYDKLNTGSSFHIVCVKDAENADEAIERLVTVMKEIEGDDYSKEEEELYRGLVELHKENGYIWLVDKPKEKTEGIREECQDEYDAFYNATDEILSNMKFTTPKVWEGGEEGADLTFETTDLDGNKINSKDLFAKNKVTMINIWATTCGPCIEEMPELEKMNKEFNKKGGAIVGLVDDVTVDNSTYLDEAQAIVKDTGVTYTNLRAWDGYYEVLSIVGTPTTYFVDSEGKLIGEPILGASTNQYKKHMEEYLSQME